MKIIEAIWEKRNLGCAAFELTLTKGDLVNIDAVISSLSEERYVDAFVTIKLPVGNLSVIHRLEDEGFRFVETQFLIGYDLSQYCSPPPPPSVSDIVVPVVQVEIEKNVQEWKHIVDLVTPDIFKTDRIALDPCFGSEIGCVRYKNWMLDLLADNDSHLYVFHMPENPTKLLGFALMKEGDKIARGILGGVFSHCEIAGVGVSIWNQYLKNLAERGFSSFETSVSSNNPAVLVMDTALGCVVKKMAYVMRRSVAH